MGLISAGFIRTRVFRRVGQMVTTIIHAPRPFRLLVLLAKRVIDYMRILDLLRAGEVYLWEKIFRLDSRFGLYYLTTMVKEFFASLLN